MSICPLQHPLRVGLVAWWTVGAMQSNVQLCESDSESAEAKQDDVRPYGPDDEWTEPFKPAHEDGDA